MVEPDGVLDDAHWETVAVRLGVSHGGSAYPDAIKATQLFELDIVQLWSERPIQSSAQGAFDVVLDGGSSQPDTATDVSVAEVMVELEAKDIPDFSHSHTLFGHPSG